MMNPWAIPALLSIFGGVLGYQGGRDQENYGREQEQLAEENASLARRELEEQVRRQEIEDSRLRSSFLARAAASGAEVGSGTLLTESTYLEDEQAREMAWMKNSGASAIRLKLEADRRRAKATQKEGKTQQWSSLLGGVAGAFTVAGQAGYFTAPKTTSVSWTAAITGPK